MIFPCLFRYIFVSLQVENNNPYMDKTFIIKYKEYSSMDELPDEERQLLHEAVAAADGSYSPYSHTLTVYKADSDGYYTVPFRTILLSQLLTM